jgi:dolichyl-phosphate-mannose-protein mannosyltransferase
LRGSKNDDESTRRIRALRTFFRLIHVNMKCDLYTRDKQLPAWGSEQFEVTCMRFAKKNDFSTFFVESSQDKRCKSQCIIDTRLGGNALEYQLAKIYMSLVTDEHPKVEYVKPSFWKNFATLNTKMYTSNEALTASHSYESRPSDWPFLHRGINYWSKEKRHIYLLGNPIAYWSSSVAAGVFLLAKVVITCREQRGLMHVNPTLMAFYARPTEFFATAWLLHWLPFFTMKRQLFLHHYMPSLYFAILISAVTFEYSTKRLSNTFRYSIAFVISAVYLYIFWRFTPVTYGLDWTKDECKRHRLRSSWDFSCDRYVLKPLVRL